MIVHTVGDEAQRTRGITRGTVDSDTIAPDGRVSVKFPGGAVFLVANPRVLRVTKGMGVSMTVNGNNWEILEVSAFQGGNGAFLS